MHHMHLSELSYNTMRLLCMYLIDIDAHVYLPILYVQGSKLRYYFEKLIFNTTNMKNCYFICHIYIYNIEIM